MFTIDDIRRAVSGAEVLRSGPTAEFSAASIDSRTIQPGELFFAIKGQRDGHLFVEDAIRKGAAGAVIAEDIVVNQGNAWTIRVKDVMEAMKCLAQYVRRQSNMRVLAITGSAGKTTTKELLAHILSGKYRVHKSAKSLNNQYGLPLTLLSVPTDTTHMVVEIGANHPGEILDLGRLAEPDVAVLTNIGYAHIEHFGSLDGTLAAKAELVETLRPNGTVVINGDDARLKSLQPQWVARGLRVRSAGRSDESDVAVSDVSWSEDGASGALRANGLHTQFSFALVGEHFLTALAVATAAALECGMGLESIASVAATFAPPEGRLNVRRASPNLSVVDDTYNASPDAVIAAVRTLGLLAGDRKIAVLGEMKELGSFSEECHRIVGTAVGGVATDLIAIGAENAKILAEAAVEAGLQRANVAVVESATRAIPVVRELCDQSDVQTVVLVKGSRFVHTERVILGLQGVPVGCELRNCTLYIQCKDCPQLLIVQGSVS